MVLDGRPLLQGLWQSLVLVRRNGWRVMGFVIVVNRVMLGFRGVWGLIGQTTLGVLVAIVGNAFLATGMLLAGFVYYQGLKREWQAAKEGKQLKR
jgi:hypothetical protein